MSKRHLNSIAFDSHYNMRNDYIDMCGLKFAFIILLYCPWLMSPVECRKEYECH